MTENRPVWVVNVRDPAHRIRFPGRDNAERWLDYRTPQLWRIEAVDEDGESDRAECGEPDTDAAS